MCDTAAGGPVPADSYRYAENLDFDNAVLTFRPQVARELSQVFKQSLGLAPLVNRGVFRHASGSYGDCVVVAAGDTGADNVVFRCFRFDYSALADDSFRLEFPALYGHADGCLWGDDGVAIGAPVVFLQVGAAAYAWVPRGAEVLAFRWDGTVALGIGALVQLPTVYGAGEGGVEWVPPCRAAAYAYGRVFCAVTSGGSQVYNSLAVSAPVTGNGNPRLMFDGVQLDIGLEFADDILGMCPVGGGRLLVFKRNSVWTVSGCDGAPGGMVCELLDAVRGCVGPSAFVPVGGAVWYASDDGIRKVEGSGAGNVSAAHVPLTAPVGAFWSARVTWPAGITPLASAVICGSRVLFSLPLDSTALNAVLVYSLALGCWTGVWTGLNAGGLVVSQLSGGPGLKMLGPDGSLQRLLTARASLGNAVTARFVSRAFDGGVPDQTKLFLRSETALLSDATRNDGTVEVPDWVDVPAVADFRSLDHETGASVTHLAGASMSGAVTKLCVLGRVCRELSLDILFKSGIVRLRSLSVQSHPREQ